TPRPRNGSAIRQLAVIVDWLPGIVITPPPDEIVILEREAEWVDAAVARSAYRIRAMLREHLAHRFGGVRRSLLLERRHVGGRRRRRRAENGFQNPGAAQHRTSPIWVRRNCQHRGH